MKLSSVIEAAASKTLTQVDLPNRTSNQHELNGVSALKEFFGTAGNISGSIEWCFLSDGSEPQRCHGEFTFYDARKKSSHRTGRSEWRFYYSGNMPGDPGIGDTVIVARTRDNQIIGLVFKKDSRAEIASHYLMNTSNTGKFSVLDQQRIADTDLKVVERQILEMLGFNVDVAFSSEEKDLVIKEFGETFPPTREMSDFARKHVGDRFDSSDLAVVAWVDGEERFFRALEDHIVGRTITKGFPDVDQFIRFSLSVHNRRKSRMGYAFQHHLGAVFNAAGLKFAAQGRTERSNKPDFLFPGEHEYHDPDFDESLLSMIGAKSSAKERWRQILTEADRIEQKHLCTLDVAISDSQIYEMKNQKLSLVIPTPVQETYRKAVAAQMISLEEFIDTVRRSQKPS